jgi:hypothetical protein
VSRRTIMIAVSEHDLGVDERYQIPDGLWEKAQVLLPVPAFTIARGLFMPETRCGDVA